MIPGYQEIIDRIRQEVTPFLQDGKVADYIPALAEVSNKQFAMSIHTVTGKEYSTGDSDIPFSIQSISKVFTLALALQQHGDDIWKRVRREPSGTAFNSLVQLEYENGIPRNPFINAGALVISDLIYNGFEKTTNSILNQVRHLASNSDITFDPVVAESEKSCGYRNTALANLMKSFGNFDHQPSDVLEVYFHQCSIAMSCKDLSKSFLFLANKGVHPDTGIEVLTKRQTKRLNSLMLTCGLYDAVGDFAYLVGLPGKSGVGGGIVAVIPGVLSVAVWSPGLNRYGNSLAGTKALELFTTYGENSIF